MSLSANGKKRKIVGAPAASSSSAVPPTETAGDHAAVMARLRNMTVGVDTCDALRARLERLQWRAENVCARALSAVCAFGDYNAYTTSFPPGHYYVYVAFATPADAVVAAHLLRHFGSPTVSFAAQSVSGGGGGDGDDFCGLAAATAAAAGDDLQHNSLKWQRYSTLSTIEWYAFERLGLVRSNVGGADVDAAAVRARRHRLPFALVTGGGGGGGGGGTDEPLVHRLRDGTTLLAVAYDWEHERLLATAPRNSDPWPAAAAATTSAAQKESAGSARANYASLATVDSLLTLMSDYAALADAMERDAQCPLRPCLGAVGGSPPETVRGVARCIATLVRVANSADGSPWIDTWYAGAEYGARRACTGVGEPYARPVALRDLLLDKRCSGTLPPSARDVYETLFGELSAAPVSAADVADTELLHADPVRGLDAIATASAALTGGVSEAVPRLRRYIEQRWLSPPPPPPSAQAPALQQDSLLGTGTMALKEADDTWWHAVALLVRVLSRRVILIDPSVAGAAAPAPHVRAAMRHSAPVRSLIAATTVAGVGSIRQNAAADAAAAADTPPTVVAVRAAVVRFLARRALLNNSDGGSGGAATAAAAAGVAMASTTVCVNFVDGCYVKVGSARDSAEMRALLHAHEMSVCGDPFVLSAARYAPHLDPEDRFVHERPNMYAGFAEHAHGSMWSVPAATMAVLVVLTGASSERLHAVRLAAECSPSTAPAHSAVGVDRMLDQSSRLLCLRAVAETLLRAHENGRVGAPDYVRMRIVPSAYTLSPALLADNSLPLSWSMRQLGTDASAPDVAVLEPRLSRMLVSPSGGGSGAAAFPEGPSGPVSGSATAAARRETLWGGWTWPSAAAAEYFTAGTRNTRVLHALAAMAPPETVASSALAPGGGGEQYQRALAAGQRTRREHALWSAALLALNALHFVSASASTAADDRAPPIDTARFVAMATQPGWSVERCVAALAPAAPDWLAWVLCRMLQLDAAERRRICGQTLPSGDTLCLGFDARWAYTTTMRFSDDNRRLMASIVHEGNDVPPPDDGPEEGPCGEGGDDDLRLASFPAWPLRAATFRERSRDDADGGRRSARDAPASASAPVPKRARRLSSSSSASVVDPSPPLTTFFAPRAVNGLNPVVALPTIPTLTTVLPAFAVPHGLHGTVAAFLRALTGGGVAPFGGDGSTDGIDVDVAHQQQDGPCGDSDTDSDGDVGASQPPDESPTSPAQRRERRRRHYERWHAWCAAARRGRCRELIDNGAVLRRAVVDAVGRELNTADGAAVARGIATTLDAVGNVRYIVRADAVGYPNTLRVFFEATGAALLTTLCNHIDRVGARFVSLPLIVRFVEADGTDVPGIGVGVELEFWQRVWRAFVETQTLVALTDADGAYMAPPLATVAAAAAAPKGALSEGADDDNERARFAWLLGVVVAKTLWDRRVCPLRLAPWLLALCMSMTLVTHMNRRRARLLERTLPGLTPGEKSAALCADACCSDALVDAALDNYVLAAGDSVGVAWPVAGDMLAARSVRQFVQRRAAAVRQFSETYLQLPDDAYVPAVQQAMRGFCVNIDAATMLVRLVGPREAPCALGITDRHHVRPMRADELLSAHVRPGAVAAVARYRQCLARELEHHRRRRHQRQTLTEQATAARTGVPVGRDADADADADADDADALDMCSTCFFVRYVLRRDVVPAGAASAGNFVRRFVRCVTSCDSIASAAASASTAAATAAGDDTGTIVLEYATSPDAWPRVQTCSRTLMLPMPPRAAAAGDVAQSFAEFCRRMDLLVSETQIFIV